MSQATKLITLTPAAAKKVIELRDEEAENKGKPLRLCVRGGGCNGFTYELYFDELNPKTDREFTLHGVDVIVDNMSLMYLVGTEIDYVESLKESGFRFNNPNVKSTCGCGSSFSA